MWKDFSSSSFTFASCRGPEAKYLSGWKMSFKSYISETIWRNLNKCRRILFIQLRSLSRSKTPEANQATFLTASVEFLLPVKDMVVGLISFSRPGVNHKDTPGHIYQHEGLKDAFDWQGLAVWPGLSVWESKYYRKLTLLGMKIQENQWMFLKTSISAEVRHWRRVILWVFVFFFLAQL